MKVLRLVSFDKNEAQMFERVHLFVGIGYPNFNAPDCSESDDKEMNALRACSRFGQQINVERIMLAIRAVDNIAANCLAESSVEYWDQRMRIDPQQVVPLHAPLVQNRGRVAEAMADVRQAQLDVVYEAQDLLQTAYTVLA